MRRILLFRKLGFVLILTILFTAYPSYSYAAQLYEKLFDMEVEKHIQLFASISGIAVESYLDGKFYESIGVFRIFPEANKMIMISFCFKFPDLSPKGSVLLQEFSIEKITKVDPKKVIIKGKNDVGYEYTASYSIINKRLDFNLVIEGRGRVEIKNLSKTGMTLKNRYLKYIDLGWINP